MDQGNPPEKTDSSNEHIIELNENSLPSDNNRLDEVVEDLSTPSEENNIDPVINPLGDEKSEALTWIKTKYLHFKSLSKFQKFLYLSPSIPTTLGALYLFFGGPTKLDEAQEIFKSPTKHQLIIHTDYPVETNSENVLELIIDQDQKTNRDCETIDSSKGKFQSFTIKCSGEIKDTIHYDLKTKNCGIAGKNGSLGEETHVQYVCN